MNIMIQCYNVPPTLIHICIKTHADIAVLKNTHTNKPSRTFILILTMFTEAKQKELMHKSSQKCTKSQ